jgi:hypothetical protein
LTDDGHSVGVGRRVVSSDIATFAFEDGVNGSSMSQQASRLAAA